MGRWYGFTENILLFFVLLFSSLHIYPQCYQGYVVDEETNACLPFATVFC